MRVGLLGTGRMGAGMARNLLAAGHELRVWNRTRERAEGLGATVCDSPAEVVITMLSDGPAVEAATEGLSLGDAVWAQMSTIGVEQTDRLAARAPGTFVDAPVLGSRPQGLGLDPRAFLDVIDGGPMGPPYAMLKGGNMVAREYAPAFSLKLARKDADLIVAAAEAAGIDLPLPRLISERMAKAIAAGHGDDDLSATVEAGRASVG
jgi:3-hydroxyisobutyrate dehydrogenase-like beta-hydroxyacid dehydrogenase